VGGSIFGKRSRKSQSGVTLVELMIATALAAVILAGSATLLHQIVVSGADSSDRAQARLEVQYVNFWLSEDVIQAQEVEIGNITNARCPDAFLTLRWTTAAGNSTVTYCVKDKPGEDLWELYRTKDARQIRVAENLDPLLTRCYQKQAGSEPLNVLVLEVASRVDRMAANAYYEISPRIGNITPVP
jgi:prepilin-type N-terminal cleavage/methylation domain-containing protein